MKTEKKPEKNLTAVKEAVISIFAVILMAALVCGLTYLRERPIAEMIRNTVAFLMGGLLVIFLWYQSLSVHSLGYDNEKHQLRFIGVWLLCFLLSMGMIYLPADSWVFLSVMVGLSMFSNMVTGLGAGCILLLTTVSLTEDGSMYIFFLYFLIGLLGISFFQKLDIEFHISEPLILSGLSSLVLQTAYLVIFENQPLQWGIVILPLLNLFINMVLLFLILKYFSGIAMYLLQDKYAEINDQEFPLLVKLREENKEEYFQAVHRTYLGERIARRLGINDKAVKGCCYYYKMASDTVSVNDTEQVPVVDYYDFPQDLKDLIAECAKGKYGSKESCVVLTSDKVIEQIKKAQNQYGKDEVPYEKVISYIFYHMLHGSQLADCDISIRELGIMEKVFREEKLYYDFLR